VPAGRNPCQAKERIPNADAGQSDDFKRGVLEGVAEWVGTNRKMMAVRVVAGALALILGMATSAGAQGTDEVTAVVPDFWVTYADGLSDKRLYRRHTITQDASNMPNVVSFVCPKDKGVLAHLTFHLASAIRMEAVVPSGFDKIDGRFLVNETSSFTLPGEVIKSDLFFDRAPGTWQEIDRIMFANMVQLRFGPHPAKLAIRTSPEFGALMKKAIPQMVKNPRFFSTKAVLSDCQKFRGA